MHTASTIPRSPALIVFYFNYYSPCLWQKILGDLPDENSSGP